MTTRTQDITRYDGEISFAGMTWAQRDSYMELRDNGCNICTSERYALLRE